MNTHDKIVRCRSCDYLGPWNSTCCERPDYDGATAEEAWHAAIEADRQARNCGQCVPLSTDGTAVFIDGVGEVPLDFSGQARGEPDGWQFFSPIDQEWHSTPDPDWHRKCGRALRAIYTAPQPQQIPEDFVDELAQEIRRVDGNHSLGAAALAERLVPFLSRTLFEAAPDGQE